MGQAPNSSDIYEKMGKDSSKDPEAPAEKDAEPAKDKELSTDSTEDQ